MCVLQVPWPPRSMAESWKRRLRWEKWSSKTLRGAVRPTDQPAGRGDAHGHVFPTRGPCRSRARWVSPVKVSYCLTKCTVKPVIKWSVSHSKKLLPPVDSPSSIFVVCGPTFCPTFCQVRATFLSRIWAKALPDILNQNCWLVRKHNFIEEFLGGIWKYFVGRISRMFSMTNGKLKLL